MESFDQRTPVSNSSQFGDTTIARQVFLVGVVVCFCGAVIFALQSWPLVPTIRAALIGACLAAATLFGLAAWKARTATAKSAVLGTAWAGCALATLMAVAGGHGIQSHSLGFCALLVCLIAVLARPSHALMLASTCAVAFGGLVAAEAANWLDGAVAAAQTPLTTPAITQFALLCAGLGIGLIVARFAQESHRRITEREQRFRTLLELVTHGYWELDAELRFVRAETVATSRPATQHTARLGLRPWEMADSMGFAPERQEKVFAAVKAHRRFAAERIHVPDESGRLRHYDVGGQPRFDATGDFLGYWGIARDVTDAVAAAEALQRSQAMLAAVFDASPLSITLTDAATDRYLMVNKMFTRLMGYAADEVIGRTALEIGLWPTAQDRYRFYEAMRAQGGVSGLRIERVAKSGATLVLEVSASHSVIDGRECVVVGARDVTEEQRTRLEYAAILERASIGIAFTRDRRFATVNPRFEQMIGWESGTLVGQPGAVVWPSEADYAEIGRLAGPLLAQGKPVELEREVRRKDGSLIWCRLIAQALDPQNPASGGTIWIAEDVTERRQTEQVLAQARDAAEAANRAKSAFLANTSHELRTPLNGLLGMARLASRPGLEEDRRQRYLAHILDSAQNLAGIINDILDLAKIEAGRIDIDHADFNLHDHLTGLHQSYLELAEAKGLTLSLALHAELPKFVTGDALRLRQILSNFVTNALKFTESGAVGIEAGPAGEGRVRVVVVDTGPGIEANVQERLFQRFSQADQSTTRRFGGTGLGLSICRELAALMGGEVGVRSEIGRGSTFWVELPLPRATPHAAPHDSQPGDLDMLRGARVLIAEDNPVNMLIVVAQLEQWGMQAVPVSDGGQAVQAVHRAAASGAPIDAVLMDLQMPNVSGTSAARQLREHFSSDRLPIIALTAAALVSERESAIQAGMCDFLTKPIDVRQLRRTLARHLARRTPV